MRVTIKDIAKKAGVSHTTVSRALNGHTSISSGKIAEIKRLSDEMGYLPSAAARGLKTNHSRALGVIVNRIDDPYFGEILQGIEGTLQDTGYSLFVASSHNNSGREENIVRALGERQVEGVIISSVAFSASHADQLQRFGMPIVVINNQSNEDYRFSIAHDDRDGSSQVVQHLIDLGHRRIAYIGYSMAGRTNLDRLNGFHQTLHAAGLPAEAGIYICQDGSEFEDGANAALELLRLLHRPTAIFCFNDLMAIGALRAIKQAGLTAPGDISVAGFDNIPFSEFTHPALTTFDQPKHQIGADAARMMLSLLASQPGPHQESGPVNLLNKGRLLVRESTAPPKFLEEIA
jgi:DNA-binding LacI/PurR family transcriptional regulator